MGVGEERNNPPRGAWQSVTGFDSDEFFVNVGDQRFGLNDFAAAIINRHNDNP